jgi:hypothetical protein
MIRLIRNITGLITAITTLMLAYNQFKSLYAKFRQEHPREATKDGHRKEEYSTEYNPV